MLQRCADPLTLNAHDELLRHFSREIGVFGVVVVVASAKRGTLDVDARSEQDADFFLTAFFAEGDSHLVDEFAVPGRCLDDGRRETGGWDAVTHPGEVGCFARLLLHAVRSIGHQNGRNAQPFDGLGLPHVQPGDERCFFFKLKLGEESFGVLHKNSLSNDRG